MRQNVRELLSESFVGPFDSMDGIWTQKLSVNHGVVAALVFAAFAKNEIYIYQGVVTCSAADRCMEGKLDLFYSIARKYCSHHASHYQWFVGIIKNSGDSLKDTKMALAKEFM